LTPGVLPGYAIFLVAATFFSFSPPCPPQNEILIQAPSLLSTFHFPYTAVSEVDSQYAGFFPLSPYKRKTFFLPAAFPEQSEAGEGFPPSFTKRERKLPPLFFFFRAPPLD